jgi:endonuclease/exonuclease/phosphatase family metal-dependent hydrolase
VSVLTIGTYNIQYGVGQDGKFDLERIARVIRSWDIIALQEVECHWDRSGNRDLPALLRGLLPDHHVAWGPNIDAIKRRGQQPAAPGEVRRQLGNMTLSRFAIDSIRNHYLPKFGAATYFDMQRGALETTIDAPGGRLRVYNTHLDHISDDQRQAQISHLQQLIALAPLEGPVLSGAHDREASWSQEPTLPAVPGSVVLLGDLNLTPDSAAYEALAGAHDPRRGRLRRHGGLIDAWPAAHQGAAPAGYTRYRDAPERRQGTRVDYCFLSEDLAARLTSAVVIDDADGSDHQPLFITLV